MSDTHKMKLNEIMRIGEYEILRVPGGWIYTNFAETGTDGLLFPSSCFVRFDYEFQQIEDEETDPVLSMSIRKLNLSARTNNCLRLMGDYYRRGKLIKGDKFETVGDLVKLTDRNLTTQPNLGKVSLKEIKDALASYGLALSI